MLFPFNLCCHNSLINNKFFLKNHNLSSIHNKQLNLCILKLFWIKITLLINSQQKSLFRCWVVVVVACITLEEVERVVQMRMYFNGNIMYFFISSYQRIVTREVNQGVSSFFILYKGIQMRMLRSVHESWYFVTMFTFDYPNFYSIRYFLRYITLLSPQLSITSSSPSKLTHLSQTLPSKTKKIGISEYNQQFPYNQSLLKYLMFEFLIAFDNDQKNTQQKLFCKNGNQLLLVREQDFIYQMAWLLPYWASQSFIFHMWQLSSGQFVINEHLQLILSKFYQYRIYFKCQQQVINIINTIYQFQLSKTSYQHKKSDVIYTLLQQQKQNMRTINTNTFGVDRKNKQNLKRFVSLLNQYQEKLDNKVDDMVNHIINYSKRCQDDLILPQINNQKTASTIRPKSQTKYFALNQKKQKTKHNRGQKSLSFTLNPNIASTTPYQNMQQKLTILKNSALKSIAKPLAQGRSIGNKRFLKPKFAKRHVDVLPREVRLDPFAEKNVIKAKDLEQGVINLVERGKIGKDVDVITAFQKGGQVLNTRQAIFHDGEERMTRNQPIKSLKSQLLPQKTHAKYSKLPFQQPSWAITMPGTYQQTKYSPKPSLPQFSSQIDFIKDSYYLKFTHYKPLKTQELMIFTIRNIEYQSEILMIFKQISMILQKNHVEGAYVDSNKVIQFATINRQIYHHQLLQMIVGFKYKNRIPLREIVNKQQHQQQSAKRMQALFKGNIDRKAFLLHLKKKKLQVKICNWLYNIKIRRNFHHQLSQYKSTMLTRFNNLQQTFRCQFPTIQSTPHYQIHISNSNPTSSFPQSFHTQITRIFNFQNPFTNIIIVLAGDLLEETKNYYYKIMELEEISNFRDRVSFFTVGRHKVFQGKNINLSQLVYYDSQLIREIQTKINGAKAYFRISYPTQSDLLMATYINIPILTGNLHQILNLQQRSSSSSFAVAELRCLRIPPLSHTLLSLTSCLKSFCQSEASTKNYVIKLNSHYQSSGIALLTYPFDSLPSIYQNTAFINNQGNVGEFYRKLCKLGGVVQIFQQGLTSVMILANIDHQAKIQLKATYDKISYGFVNVGYMFPQMTLAHHQIMPVFNQIMDKLVEARHFGDVQISLFIDQDYKIYLDKVQCYLTQIGSSLFYFKFLCPGTFTGKGHYTTTITQTYQCQQLRSIQPRSYCSFPFIVHSGLSPKQCSSFFQLCRISGISFDLQNKYGSTFILLGSMKDCMGMITIAKDRDGCRELMEKGMGFVARQNQRNDIRKDQNREKDSRNILKLKQRLQQM